MRILAAIILSLITITLVSSCKKDKDNTTQTAYYPTDSLVAYFSFDENINDAKGNVTAGTNYGNAALTTGMRGKALSFNGINQRVEYTSGPFNSTNGMSFSFWIKADSMTSLYYLIDAGIYGFWTSDPNNAGMAVSVPSTNSTGGLYNAGQWNHIVGTYDGADITIYINGTYANSVSWPGTLNNNNSALYISSSGGSFWKGSIDELAIYHKILTQEEINKLFYM